ncbi:MAG: MBL fold metallo-hydrolase [Bernardetiaceae bacterium]|jgi:L-ascorbate metabolism protein UlaG (beta-lactamase superfamily)|nr:MBL fold metallo-hydrolase [Bernardetiaceae bacterium]
MLYFLIGLGGLALLVWGYLQTPPFGQTPSGERLARIKRSPQYHDGKFQNESVTPQLTEGVTYWQLINQYRQKIENQAPTQPLPSQKTDLKALAPTENVVVWFGHSSYFIQVDGFKILVDPVFSGRASPVPVGGKSYLGTDVYQVADLPAVDLLYISHDHYDHLDYATVKQLPGQVTHVVTGLGVGAHLERWGFAPGQITELDWHQAAEPLPGLTTTAAPARHFSGRGLVGNQTLWTSLVVKTATQTLYLGGDSGYDQHFAAIGATYGPFDLAVIEAGQYNASWRYLHLMPGEIVPAARQLQAKVLLPVHWGKFTLALHPWPEPIEQVLATADSLPVLTPLIGQKATWQPPAPLGQTWWKPQ